MSFSRYRRKICLHQRTVLEQFFVNKIFMLDFTPEQRLFSWLLFWIGKNHPPGCAISVTDAINILQNTLGRNLELVLTFNFFSTFV